MHDDNLAAEEQPSDSALGNSSSDSDPESPKASISKSAAKHQKAISSSLAAAEHNQQGSLGPDAELQEFQNVQERREELKQQMAVTASKLLQNPEANLPTMRSLLTLAADKDIQVSGAKFSSWV
jgi:multidrug resistance efflux pump